MTVQVTPIPSYRKPPIVEAVWSIQFSEMPWLLSPYTGIYWNLIKTSFPHCEEHPPIRHVTEPSDIFINSPQPQIELRPLPPTRQWFISNSRHNIIQLQKDRLCCNWRKVQAQEGCVPSLFVHESAIRRCMECLFKLCARFWSGTTHSRSMRDDIHKPN